MGVEIRESPVAEDEFHEMRAFVREYLRASVEREDEGGRMRWYPWHSATYRFNHSLNVAALAGDIAEGEGANVDAVRVAALFHDVAKLDAEQDRHAAEGARVTREYLRTRGDYPESFVEQVCRSVENHSYQGPVTDLSLETQCLVEGDVLDKVGANGTALMLLRMGYESRSHMDTVEMIERVRQRGIDALDRVESNTGHTVANKRLKRVEWFMEWLADEVVDIELPK